MNLQNRMCSNGGDHEIFIIARLLWLAVYVFTNKTIDGAK
jgi:hypothetical protein